MHVQCLHMNSIPNPLFGRPFLFQKRLPAKLAYVILSKRIMYFALEQNFVQNNYENM